MKRLIAIACLLILVTTGCSRTIEAKPVKAPQDRIDCNLIFPGPGGA